MQLFKYIWYKIKKIYKIMIDAQDNPQLARIKQEYFGKEYQWVRPINNEEVGEVVRVTDVKVRDNMYLLVFSSGTPVNIELIANHLIPHNAKEPALVPNPKQQFPLDAPIKQAQQQPDVPAKPPAIFGMFESHEMTIMLPINMKLPEIALVKAMYNNAADKNAFLLEFAAYMKSEMTIEIIKNAIAELMGDKIAAPGLLIGSPKIVVPDNSENNEPVK